MLKLPRVLATARAFVTLTGASLTLSGAHAAPEAARFAPSAPIFDSLDFSDTDFTRAVAELEQCRSAQSRAERRAARGALSRKALEIFRDATRRAQMLVEKLRAVRPTADGVNIVVDGGGINTFVPATTSSPIMRPLAAPPANTSIINAPRPTRVVPPNVNILVSATPSAQGTSVVSAKVPVPATTPSLARPEPGQGDGSISTAPFGSGAQFGSPHINGLRPSMAPIASLPGAVTLPKAAPVATTAPPLAMAPKITPAPAGVPTFVKPAPDTKKDARTRLAALDAQLNHAEKRLNAANIALSEGQVQLAQFAGTLRQAMLEAGPEATGLHPFVKIAEKYAGTPYVWGGESRGGFDCSGLIILVMRELGYKTPPHSAAEQFKYGVPIAQPLLKPGDLVFFANTYKPGISHVGIYLGKRRFIHAAGTGKGTIVSSLDTPHFQQKYAGGRRLVQAH